MNIGSHLLLNCILLQGFCSIRGVDKKFNSGKQGETEDYEQDETNEGVNKTTEPDYG